jgi:predicted nucleic acid-binding protein
VPLLVVDASAVVELICRTRASAKAAARLENATLAAPAHLDAEVLSAIARMARANPIDEPLVSPRLAKLRRAPITRYLCPAFLADAWALNANIAVRDALYVALARRLGADLVTADRRLARAVVGVGMVAHVV